MMGSKDHRSTLLASTTLRALLLCWRIHPIDAIIITMNNGPDASLPVGSGQADDVIETALASMGPYFDALLDRMQTPEAQAAFDTTFRASPEELGRAAVEAAATRRRTGDG